MFKTKVCTFNFEDEEFEKLKEKISIIYQGSIGRRIEIPNKGKHFEHYCLLNLDFPPNFHEYDIFIIDLEKKEVVDYIDEEHQQKYVTGNSTMMLKSSYPQTIFDPKPLSLHLLKEKIDSLIKKTIFVVFTESNYEIDYQPVVISDTYPKLSQKQSYSLYNFLNFPINNDGKFGVETKVNKLITNDLNKILSKYNDKSYYNQTFYHPEILDNEKQKYISDPNFIPLMYNGQDEIISFAQFDDKLSLFVIPQIKRKGDFILEFLFEFAPNIVPELFPDIVKNEWKNEKTYYLPNHESLLLKKTNEIDRHKREIESITDEIVINNIKFGYLHDMLIESGDELVNSIIIFLKWLGFKNAIEFDTKKEKNNVLEEDIQIETSKGLIIIEVKGIGGTSKDSECSQISKIKYRRSKERNSFDVYAHYIVNHQRHLPPLKRKNPPFTDNQKNDAVNDERGLITTWQLYKLYYMIHNNIISKKDAREKFYTNGVLNFKPNCQLIGQVKEVYKNGLIVIINLNEIRLTIGDELLVEKNQQLNLVTITSIKLNDIDVGEAYIGEVGLMLNKKIENKSIIYKKLQATM